MREGTDEAFITTPLQGRTPAPAQMTLGEDRASFRVIPAALLMLRRAARWLKALLLPSWNSYCCSFPSCVQRFVTLWTGGAHQPPSVHGSSRYDLSAAISPPERLLTQVIELHASCTGGTISLPPSRWEGLFEILNNFCCCCYLLAVAWDPLVPARDWTCAPCFGSTESNHWTTREIPLNQGFNKRPQYFISHWVLPIL